MRRRSRCCSRSAKGSLPAFDQVEVRLTLRDRRLVLDALRGPGVDPQAAELASVEPVVLPGREPVAVGAAARDRVLRVALPRNYSYLTTRIMRSKFRRQVAGMISQRVREARGAAGLSRMDVAQALGVSMSTVIRIETGRADISISRLAELARLTGKPVGFFLEDEVAA